MRESPEAVALVRAGARCRIRCCTSPLTNPGQVDRWRHVVPVVPAGIAVAVAILVVARAAVLGNWAARRSRGGLVHRSSSISYGPLNAWWLDWVASAPRATGGGADLVSRLSATPAFGGSGCSCARWLGTLAPSRRPRDPPARRAGSTWSSRFCWRSSASRPSLTWSQRAIRERNRRDCGHGGVGIRSSHRERARHLLHRAGRLRTGRRACGALRLRQRAVPRGTRASADSRSRRKRFELLLDVPFTRLDAQPRLPARRCSDEVSIREPRPDASSTGCCGTTARRSSCATRGYRYVHLQSTWGGTGEQSIRRRFPALQAAALFRDDYLRAVAEATWLQRLERRASLDDLAECHLQQFRDAGRPCAGAPGPKFVVRALRAAAPSVSL